MLIIAFVRLVISMTFIELPPALLCYGLTCSDCGFLLLFAWVVWYGWLFFGLARISQVIRLPGLWFVSYPWVWLVGVRHLLCFAVVGLGAVCKPL